MTEIYLSQIPEFIKKGSFFKPLYEDVKHLNEDEETIIISVYKENDEINSLSDLLLYFQVIDYCMLATRYIKFHIYQYIFDNRKKIIQNYNLITYIKNYPEMQFLVNVADECNCDECNCKFDECNCEFYNEMRDNYYIIKCVENNYITALKILDDNCFQQWRVCYDRAISYVCEIAAKNGFFHCIKYIYETHDEELYNLFDWGSSIELAAKNGHLNIIIYAHQHGYLFSKHDYIAAETGGHLNCLKYLHEYGSPLG